MKAFSQGNPVEAQAWPIVEDGRSGLTVYHEDFEVTIYADELNRLATGANVAQLGLEYTDEDGLVQDPFLIISEVPEPASPPTECDCSHCIREESL